MYRILASLGESQERRAQRGRVTYEAPFVRATAPNEVWVWDITALPAPQRGQFFYLYAVMDLYSRFVVSWQVAHVQSGDLAERLFLDACAVYDIAPASLCVHSDRGAPMTSYRLTHLFEQLGVMSSFSRPRISDDNPHIESQFKTMKYQPDFPLRFHSYRSAVAWCDDYYAWYNNDHHHAGIAFYTPADVFFGRVAEVWATRQAALDRAYRANPERFVGGPPVAPRPPEFTEINPADLFTPEEAQTAPPSKLHLARLPNSKGRKVNPQLRFPIF
jgi:putative transposase